MFDFIRLWRPIGVYEVGEKSLCDFSKLPYNAAAYYFDVYMCNTFINLPTLQLLNNAPQALILLLSECYGVGYLKEVKI